MIIKWINASIMVLMLGVVLIIPIGLMVSMNIENIITKAGSVEINFSIPCDTIFLSTSMTYNPTVAQCDGDPFGTADGSRIDPIKLKNKQIHWVALSRDLIWCPMRQKLFSDTTHWRGPIPFGATIFIKSLNNPQVNGHWVVHDCKAPRLKRSIDFLMDPSNNIPKLGVDTTTMIINSQLINKINNGR